jgi:hypothetical protein
MNEDKKCSNCIHFNTCKFRIDSYELMMKGFLDFDRPGGGEFLNSFWTIIADRCNHFKENK